MTERYPLSVRLTAEKHAQVKSAAADEGVTIPALMARVLTSYADGPVPKPVPKAPPQSLLKRTLVDLPPSVRKAAEKRAKAEGRNLSQVVAELIASA